MKGTMRHPSTLPRARTRRNLAAAALPAALAACGVREAPAAELTFTVELEAPLGRLPWYRGIEDPA
jgi:hypothetical protein